MQTSVALYLGLLALFAAERVFELFLSRRNAAQALAQGGIEVGQRHFRVMSALHTLFFLSCGLEVLLLHRGFPPVLGWIALGGCAFAQALRYWAIATLGPRWNVRVIVVPDGFTVYRGHPGGAAGTEGRTRGESPPPRRHVPQLGMHPDQVAPRVGQDVDQAPARG